MEAF
jgi:hypothetical protein